MYILFFQQIKNFCLLTWATAAVTASGVENGDFLNTFFMAPFISSRYVLFAASD
jgi:hypothetical protein